MTSRGNKAGGGTCCIVHTSSLPVVLCFERITAFHVVLRIGRFFAGLIICAEGERVRSVVVKVTYGVSNLSSRVGRGSERSIHVPGASTASCVTVAISDDEASIFACDVAQTVAPISLAAIRILTADVPFGVGGLSTFVAVSIDGE